jgi:enterochelin esterase family protein
MLQSGSFFTAALDAQESGYGQFAQICSAVADIAGTPATRTCRVVITCGTVEENRANNELIAEVLTAQGYQVRLRLVPDAHNMIGWRDAWSPDLEELLHNPGGVSRS